MSPTSYQTAPPRISIIAMLRGSVKPAAFAAEPARCPSFEDVTFARFFQLRQLPCMHHFYRASNSAASLHPTRVGFFRI